MCSVTCCVVQRVKCPPCLPGLVSTSAWLLPSHQHQLLCPHPRDTDLELGHTTTITPSTFILHTGLVLLFSYCRFLYISQYQDIFYLGRQSINLTQITFTEKFSCALAPSSISLVRFILCCGNININSIEEVPAAVPSPAPACRQLWGSAAALKTSLVATLTAHLKTCGENILRLMGRLEMPLFLPVTRSVSAWISLQMASKFENFLSLQCKN